MRKEFIGEDSFIFNKLRSIVGLGLNMQLLHTWFSVALCSFGEKFMFMMPWYTKIPTNLSNYHGNLSQLSAESWMLQFGFESAKLYHYMYLWVYTLKDMYVYVWIFSKISSYFLSFFYILFWILTEAMLISISRIWIRWKHSIEPGKWDSNHLNTH